MNVRGSKLTAYKKCKNIVIFDRCQYTAQGVILLCNNNPEWGVVSVVKSYDDLLRVVERRAVDLIICGIGNHTDEFSKLINMIRVPVRGRILLTNKSSEVMNKIFLAAGFDAVISKQSALVELIKLIDMVLYQKMGDRLIRHNESFYRPHEREVLSELLKGERPCDIASSMGISYRAVSRYKLSGLRRAGLSSLNEILACQKGSLLE